MSIIHMDTEAVQQLASQLLETADTISQARSLLTQKMGGIGWEGGSSNQFADEANMCFRTLSTLLEQLHEMNAALRAEIAQWEEGAAEFAIVGIGSWLENFPGIMEMLHNFFENGAFPYGGLFGMGLGSLTLAQISQLLDFTLLPDTSGKEAWQLALDKLSYLQLKGESERLQALLTSYKGDLSKLPSLEALKNSLATNASGQAQTQAEIDQLKAELIALRKEANLAADEGSDFWNQLIPDWPLKRDDDGVPWRVIGDDYEDQYDSIQQQIEAKQKDLIAASDRMHALKDQEQGYIAQQEQVTNLQSKIKESEAKLAYTNVKVKEKTPQVTTHSGSSPPIPGAHDVPLVNQKTLVYKGQNGNLACTPSSISMVTQYYNKQDSSNTSLSPTQLIKMQEGDPEGYSMSKGSKVTSFTDDLKESGYSAKAYNNNSISDLQSQTKDGPVVALIRQKGTNAPHAVVVTGVKDGKVSVADPWGGTHTSYTSSTFNQMWQGLGNGWIYEIRPGS